MTHDRYLVVLTLVILFSDVSLSSLHKYQLVNAIDMQLAIDIGIESAIIEIRKGVAFFRAPPPRNPWLGWYQSVYR